MLLIQMATYLKTIKLHMLGKISIDLGHYKDGFVCGS